MVFSNVKIQPFISFLGPKKERKGQERKKVPPTINPCEFLTYGDHHIRLGIHNAKKKMKEMAPLHSKHDIVLIF